MNVNGESAEYIDVKGVKIKMDDAGNILVRRYAKSNVYVKSTASNASEETSIGADILKLPNQALESEKIVKLFDMKKFQSNVIRELRRAYPDRRRLETQCLSAVAFVKSENDILECPIWVLIVNVVAMDMLKSKMPPVQRPMMVDIKNRPRIPIPDEDPYSVAGNASGGSSGSSGFGGSGNNSHQQSVNGSIVNGNSNNSSSIGTMQLNGNSNGSTGGHVAATREQLLLQTQQLAHKRSEKPPKLPPRDNIYSHDLIPKPDYDDIDVESRIKLSRGKSDKGKDNKKYDDPYYCGLRARVPNFVKSSKSAKDHKDGHPLNSSSNNGSNNAMSTLSQKKTSMMHMPMHAPTPPHMHPHHIQQQQMMAVAAAHAVHHPVAAHHHHHQMWPSRNFDNNGALGIYNSITPTYHVDHAYNQTIADSMHGHGRTNGHINAQATTHAHLPKQIQYRQHHRHHSRSCRRTQQQPPLSPPSRPRTSHKQVNCNCVSCYTLAPLFGAVTPARPPRSLSQQQLRQHHLLSGSLNEAPPPKGLVKWCSESDISELDRSGFDDDYDYSKNYAYYGNEQSCSYDEDFDFDLNMDFEDDVTYARRFTKPTLKEHTYKDHDVKHNGEFIYGNRRNEELSLSDIYLDKTKLRQLRSPAPPQPPQELSNSNKNVKRNGTALLTTRNKSHSTESCFTEQPNEEIAYMYGGRKRITKVPSAANIYDRVRNSIDSDGTYASAKFSTNLKSNEQRTANSTMTTQKSNDSKSSKPLLPAPCWRGKRAESFKEPNKNVKEQKKSFISNICSGTKMKTLEANSQQQKNKSDNNNNNKNKNNNLNINEKNKQITTAPTTNPSNKTTMNTTVTAQATTAKTNTDKATQAKHILQQQQPQHQHQRVSRLDISDMESIYGYLKPRKPRSLSLKKIQILDY
ncbi:nuclear transcription factor Y subunit gamma-like [Teleopsis dalmanni]|uniref:nuclear transcription factor Y subunit gamma-like n=1 Tax=Teleopsis dalmanni TaxID=139649 RepID=UPI0018CD687C|nr:nuclear transcription factor Y subunit gamma-like [Teleopsis dalmanni]